MIRVLVADSHPLYRDGVTRVIRQCSAFRLVGEAGDAASTLTLLSRLRPDIAVVDPVTLRIGMSTLLALTVRESLPTRVILLVGAVRPAEAYEAVARGAMAYLSKHATAGDIEEAIRRAASGEATISRELQTHIVEQIRLRDRTEGPSLSPRELQVLARVADGCSAREIAAEFIVAPSTVRTHIQRVCDKLGVHDRAAAVAVGMRLGMLD